MFHLHSIDFIYPHQNLEFPKARESDKLKTKKQKKHQKKPHQDNIFMFASIPGLSFVYLPKKSWLPGPVE